MMYDCGKEDRNRRAFAAAEAKHLEPPEDTPEFEKAKARLWDENIMDVGTLLEALSEQPDVDLLTLAKWIISNMSNQTSEGDYSFRIGESITQWVTDYCEPSTDAVIKYMESEA
jgi:hypothetical protein